MLLSVMFRNTPAGLGLRKKCIKVQDRRIQAAFHKRRRMSALILLLGSSFILSEQKSLCLERYFSYDASVSHFSLTGLRCNEDFVLS